MDFSSQWIYDLLLTAPPLLFSLTVHEFAHARTALAFGDRTAALMGRCTLNPLAHLDPLGTITLLVTRMIGWAKPVPVNPLNLHPRRLGDICVSLAGPLSNFLLAILAGLLLRVALAFETSLAASTFHVLFQVLWFSLVANLGLCVFNLLPLFPLDGHHIARELLPIGRHAGFMHWQLRYGRPILMALIFVPIVLGRTGGSFPDPIRFVHGRLLDLTLRIVGF